MTYEYDPYTDRYRGDQPATRRPAGQQAVTTRTGYRRRPAQSSTGPIIIAAISLVLVVVVAYAVAEFNKVRVTPSQVRVLALSTVRQLPSYDLKPAYFEMLVEQSHPRAWRIAYEENQEPLSPERRQRLYNRSLLRRMAELARIEGQEQVALACLSGLGE